MSRNNQQKKKQKRSRKDADQSTSDVSFVEEMTNSTNESSPESLKPLLEVIENISKKLDANSQRQDENMRTLNTTIISVKTDLEMKITGITNDKRFWNLI